MPPSLPQKFKSIVRSIVHSGWFAYVTLMTGAGLFEYETTPWTNPFIPNPYVTFYAVGTTLLALRGYSWGLFMSFSWYVTRHFYWIWTQTRYEVYTYSELIRFLLHIIFPVSISWWAARRRKAKDDLLADLEERVKQRTK